jgi:hypothetical protein
MTLTEMLSADSKRKLLLIIQRCADDSRGDYSLFSHVALTAS